MKIQIDLDIWLIDAAAKVLGTTTATDTVHAALIAATAKAERRACLLRNAGGPDFGDESVMAGAWA